MIKLPEPDDTWSPSEVHDILLAFSTGQLIEAKPDERLEIKILNGWIVFRGFHVARLEQASTPATVMFDFQDLVLGLDND